MLLLKTQHTVDCRETKLGLTWKLLFCWQTLIILGGAVWLPEEKKSFQCYYPLVNSPAKARCAHWRNGGLTAIVEGG